jgi:hypothetical protein
MSMWSQVSATDVVVIDRLLTGQPRISGAIDGDAVHIKFGARRWRRDLLALDGEARVIDAHQRPGVPAEHPEVAVTVHGAAVRTRLVRAPVGDLHLVLDRPGLAVEARDVPGLLRIVEPADPHARQVGGALVGPERRLPGDRTRAGAVQLWAVAAGQRRAPQDAIVVAERPHIGGAARGLQSGLAVAQRVAALGLGGDLGDAAGPVGDRDVAEQIDRGARRIRLARGHAVASGLDPAACVDLRHGALRRVGDPDVLKDLGLRRGVPELAARGHALGLEAGDVEPRLRAAITGAVAVLTPRSARWCRA